jgi:ligand-binding sensor domain-containing protein
VFDVVYNPATGKATFTSLDGNGKFGLGDLPVGTVQRDEKKGTLYVGTDFGVAELKSHGPGWKRAFPQLPVTVIPYLKIDQQNRIMYITSHGFGAWSAKLP